MIFLARGLAGRHGVKSAIEQVRDEQAKSEEQKWRLQHVQPFDGLRALAVLAVMVHHAHVPRGLGGFLGVDIFFVLSGFLITALLVQERDRSGTVDFKRFYMRRALRLFPALIAMTAIVGVVLLAWPAGELRSNSFTSLPFALAYLTNYMAMVVDRGLGVFGHTWSLAIEEQFYLLWPPVLVAGLRRWKPSALATISLVVAVGIAMARALVWLATSNIELLYFPLHARGDALLIGCAAALIMTSSPARLVESIGTKTGWLAVAAGALILAIATVATTVSGWMYLFGLFLVAGASIVVIAQLAANPDSRIGLFLGWRPLAAIGGISYGLYLWHFPVFELIKDRYPTLPFRYLVVLQFGVSFIAAFVSYAVVEKPFLRLKSRFTA